MQEYLHTSDAFKMAVVLRMARVAVGWSQVELAEKIGIAKTTLARFETLEGGLRADQLTQLLRLYREMGVEVDFLSAERVSVHVDEAGLRAAFERIQDADMRRKDRRRSGSFLDRQG